MNHEALQQQQTAKRKLPLESLFLAIVMTIGLIGIYGIFVPPQKSSSTPEWQSPNMEAAAEYVQLK